MTGYWCNPALSQFFMASAPAHFQGISPVRVLSAPHSSARKIKELLFASAQ